MPDARWQRMWDIVHGVEGKAPDEKAAFLDEACAGDSDLRREVENLLSVRDRPHSLLDRPDLLEPLLQPAGEPNEMLGQRIGSYRLKEVIGEGGMGVVFAAEQEEPIHRRVALKLIKLGLDTREWITRFEAERQAIALMDHSGIAKVHDAGVTELGRPYFVMEEVKGPSITEYCDQHKLTTRDRLQLFTLVCQAVQHAHRRGIIHRDLKPSNILVTVEDGSPTPKIIDFGVAKAIDHRLTERTLYTQEGRWIGTPEFMSPEQLEPQPDIDTRADVYSLGVLLYRLLTGVLPFRSEDLRKTDLAEVQRIIREEDPPSPSTRVSRTGADSQRLAEKRNTDPVSLSRQLKGELDWIVMKALEKDRDRRFGTASDLAADIARFLDHRPVQAGPPSVGYRARKFVRRHRLGVGIAAALIVALVGFAVVMTVQSARISRALRAAEQEREKTQQVSDFLVDLFQTDDPRTAGGRRRRQGGPCSS